jgi:hypothetical protein
MTWVRVKQRTYFPLVSATEMAIWQAILTQPNLPSPLTWLIMGPPHLAYFVLLYPA